jgi:hypothetical protein
MAHADWHRATAWQPRAHRRRFGLDEYDSVERPASGHLISSDNYFGPFRDGGESGRDTRMRYSSWSFAPRNYLRWH